MKQIILSLLVTLYYGNARAAASETNQSTNPDTLNRRISYLEEFSFTNPHFTSHLHQARNHFGEKAYSHALGHIIQAERECGFIHEDGKIIGAVTFHLSYDSDDYEKEGKEEGSEDLFAGIPEVDDTDLWTTLEKLPLPDPESPVDEKEGKEEKKSTCPTATRKPPRPPGPPKPRTKEEPLSIRTPPAPFAWMPPIATDQTVEEKAFLEELFG